MSDGRSNGNEGSKGTTGEQRNLTEQRLTDLASSIDAIRRDLTEKLSRGGNLPLVVAVFAAALGAFGNIYVVYTENEGSLALEKQRLQQQLLLNAVKSNEIETVKNNLRFLLDTRLLVRSDSIDTAAIREYVFEEDGDPLIVAPTAAVTSARRPGFNDSKRRLADIHERIGHSSTLYCGCSYVRVGASGGKVDLAGCGLVPRRSEARANRVEWEHVVPATWIGRGRQCWSAGHALCVRPDGSSFRGRECCAKEGVDEDFMAAYTDMHNMFPVSGEINGDRLAHPFGDVEGERRQYGACDFEVGGQPVVAEPASPVRGEIARAILYMVDGYGLDVPADVALLEEWDNGDPPERWEIERATEIEVESGQRNPFID